MRGGIIIRRESRGAWRGSLRDLVTTIASTSIAISVRDAKEGKELIELCVGNHTTATGRPDMGSLWLTFVRTPEKDQPLTINRLTDFLGGRWDYQLRYATLFEKAADDQKTVERAFESKWIRQPGEADRARDIMQGCLIGDWYARCPERAYVDCVQVIDGFIDTHSAVMLIRKVQDFLLTLGEAKITYRNCNSHVLHNQMKYFTPDTGDPYSITNLLRYAVSLTVPTPMDRWFEHLRAAGVSEYHIATLGPFLFPEVCDLYKPYTDTPLDVVIRSAVRQLLEPLAENQRKDVHTRKVEILCNELVRAAPETDATPYKRPLIELQCFLHA